MASALAALREALDARPWELPGALARRALWEALAPGLRVVSRDAARERPELAADAIALRGIVVVPEPPGAAALRARARLRARLGTGDAEPDRIAWPHARIARPGDDDWRALALRRAAVARAAQSVVPMWMHVRPDDERPLSLLDDLELAPGAAPSAHALRTTLERELAPSDPGATALRALLLAHEHSTHLEDGTESCDLDELCALAWADADAALVPRARTHEPMARAEAWMRWWIDEAVPALLREAR